MTGEITLFAGTKNGIFRLSSREGRRDWKIDGPWLRGWEVTDLRLLDGAEPQLVAAGYHFMEGVRILRSEGLGDSWSYAAAGPAFDVSSGASLRGIWTLALGPPDDEDVLYAGTDEAALFVSRDRGDHWREVGTVRGHPTREDWVPSRAGLCCHTIVSDPDDSGRMWIGISAAGVLRTVDGGKSWQLVNQGLPLVVPSEKHPGLGSCVHHLALSSTGALFQQNHQGVFRSLDGAESWQRVHQGLPATERERCPYPEVFGLPVAVHPHKPDTVYLVPMEGDDSRFCHGGRMAVYRSTDGGENWHDLRQGLPQSHQYAGILRHAFCLDGFEQCGIYFGTTSGQLFHSRDEGESWRQIEAQLPRIYSLRCYPSP